MSAWLVDEETIHVLMEAALRRPRYDPHFSYIVRDAKGEFRERREVHAGNADEVGRMLWKANLDSVNYRYGERRRPRDVYHYHYQKPRQQWSIPAILKSLHCYRYQSCERSDWKQSDAFAFVQALEQHLISLLPGYDQAPWGIGPTDAPQDEN